MRDAEGGHAGSLDCGRAAAKRTRAMPLHCLPESPGAGLGVPRIAAYTRAMASPAFPQRIAPATRADTARGAVAQPFAPTLAGLQRTPAHS
jgi:hypothetical protein